MRSIRRASRLGVATPVVFQLFDLFDRALNYRRATETSFRLDRQIRRGRN